ncbi:hypothetical protein ACLI09_10860 [Flavobacterium sp. RHBU_24]|uniref:hypothetical protein n=1 Tax=Flavobacterium sp. RHBU_24 TaxID=3391185 RepID=UPI003985593A
MKKIFLTAGAVLAFVAAGAQETPAKVLPPDKGKPVNTHVMEQNKREMEPTPDGAAIIQPRNATTVSPAASNPEPGEPLAPDHVKSTPPIKTARDSTAAKRPRKAKRN